MPEARLKQQISEPERSIAAYADQPISADAVMSAFEQICLAMSASGAVVAMRDLEGVRCVVSFGNAPPVGTRLQADSAFTTECIESGEAAVCEDTENDLRIQPEIAKRLNLRSAVAVPIHARGSVVGLIEVFCSQPSAIYPSAVTALKRVAKLFAAIQSGPDEVPIAASSPGTFVPLEAASTVEPTIHQRQAATETPQSVVASPQPIIDQQSASIAHLRAVVSERFGAVAPAEAEPTAFGRTRTGSNSRRFWFWLISACLGWLAVLLFLFVGSNDRKDARTSGNAVVPPASDRARSNEAKTASAASQPGEKVEAPNSKDSPLSSRSEAPLVTDSGSASERGEVQRRADPSEPGAVPNSGSTLTSSLSPREGHPRRGTTRELKSPNPADRAFSATSREAPELGFRLPADTASADISGVRPALASPIKPRVSTPDFVLNRTLKGHSDWVTGVAFRSSGVLASGSWDQSIKFWDVGTGRELEALRDKVKRVQALAFSHDGHWLATEDSTNTVTVWDATNGREIRTLPSDKPTSPIGKSWVYSIGFSPDGRWLASGVDDQTIRIWDMSTGQKVRDLIGPRRSVTYVAFSPDGRLLASGNDDKTIQIWDPSTGTEIRVLSGHKKPVYAVAFSPDSRRLASASGDKTIKLWDVSTGRELRTLMGHQNAVTSLAFSPDGRWLASGSWDKTIKIWDAVAGTELQTLSGPTHSIYTVAFDSGGDWLASGSEDGTVNLWRLAMNRPDVRTRSVRPR
jgi:WD domain, G-beta repeat/GAF domain